MTDVPDPSEVEGSTDTAPSKKVTNGDPAAGDAPQQIADQRRAEAEPLKVSLVQTTQGRAEAEPLKVSLVQTTQDRILSLLPLGFSLIALFISLFTAWLSTTKDQPAVRFYFNSEPELQSVGWWLLNAGDGSTEIKNISITYDGKAEENLTWAHLEAALAVLEIPADAMTGWDYSANDLVQANDESPILVFRNAEYLRRKHPDLDVDAAAESLRRYLQFHITYTVPPFGG